MNTGNAHYVTPKDRTTREILGEMGSMSLPDLAALLIYAQQLNRARLEYEARLRQVYPSPPEPMTMANNQVPERIAVALTVSSFVAGCLVDELTSGSTEYAGQNPEELMGSLAHVARCHLVEKPRSDYLDVLRRALVIFDCELLEETPDAE